MAVSAMPRPAPAWGRLLREQLEGCEESQRPRLFVLPEGGVLEPGPCDAGHPIVCELAPIAKEFNVVIVAGTLLTQEEERVSCICPVIDAGGLVGCYRKRTQSAFVGREDGVFWSRSDGIVHRLPMPEPCMHAQGTSEGSVLVLGRFGGAWEVWPTQNRERVMFEHLWRQAS
mmetsp:Transcript_54745/g.177093  ORF Transcript_54745/g.177093 Transcript_54745/m.177093 type:complete len:172 (-) Transcript_54745:166-681(-)